MTPIEILRHVLGSPKPPLTVAAPAPADSAGAKPTDEESLGRELLQLDSGIGLFRWVHLIDALDRSPGVGGVISFGSGGGLHEAFLARTRPALDVTGVDLREPWVARDLTNLRFMTGDLLDPVFRAALPKANFIFSIECLEHIGDDLAVVKAMADRLMPGSHLYIQVPFANRFEQADPVLRENERKCFGHVRPGYDDAGLRAFASRLDLDVLFVAGAFWLPLQPIIGAAVEKLGPALAPHWRAVLDLVSRDVRPGLPADRSEAIAIKMLARKRP